MENYENLILKELLKIKPELQGVKDGVDHLSQRLEEYMRTDGDKFSGLESRVAHLEGDLILLKKYNERLEEWKTKRNSIIGFIWKDLGISGIVQIGLKYTLLGLICIFILTFSGFGIEHFIHEPASLPHNVNAQVVIRQDTSHETK